ncbi:hypothetical protein HDG33_000688 [Paraburkholderia sp. Cpub6]|nr:hypothetical protein [Paraburkholderia sp. Cpub6]
MVTRWRAGNAADIAEVSSEIKIKARKNKNPAEPRLCGVSPPLLAETEGCQTAGKAFTSKDLEKHLSITHTSTHIKKTGFFAVWDAPIPDFGSPKDGSNPDSGLRPRTDDGYVTPGEILHIARGQRRPSECVRAAIMASNWLIGLPALSRDPAILAFASAASLSNARSRPAKSSTKIASTAVARAPLREPSGSRCSP